MNKDGESRRSVLIVGGYGVVGAQIAEILSARNPELHLLIAGRSQENANSVAAKFPHAQGIHIDVDQADPLANLPNKPAAVLAVANDSEDNLLRSAVRRAIPYVDITRWTERMQTSILRLAPAPLAAPVILSSGWMAGVVATVAAADASEFSRVDSINIDILYALQG
ncbi:MAG: hypothetical protein FJ178_00695 [Gammaproteobacteria bacterium]|nr:hypothetical protein [Gammaproteobacteria bacterium]